MSKALQVGLFYGTMLLQHAEWIKHEAETQNIHVELFSEPFEEPEKLDEFDCFLFMAEANETELVKSFQTISFIVNELEIPFIWAVDKKKNPMAYRYFDKFEELGNVEIFLTTLFELAEEFKPKKPPKESIMSKLKSELAKKPFQQEEVAPTQEEIPPSKEVIQTNDDPFGGLENLGALPPLEEIGSNRNQPNQTNPAPMQEWVDNQEEFAPKNNGFTPYQGNPSNVESIFSDTHDNEMKPNNDQYNQQQPNYQPNNDPYSQQPSNHQAVEFLPYKEEPYKEPQPQPIYREQPEFQKPQPFYQGEEPFYPTDENNADLSEGFGQNPQMAQQPNWNQPMQNRQSMNQGQQPVKNANQSVQPQQQQRQMAPMEQQQQPVAPPYTYGQEQPQVQVQQSQPQQQQRQMAPMQPNNGQGNGYPMQQQSTASQRQNQQNPNMGGNSVQQSNSNFGHGQELGGYSNFNNGNGGQDMGYSAPQQPNNNYPPQQQQQQENNSTSIFGNDDFGGNDNGFSVFQGQSETMFPPYSENTFGSDMEPLEEKISVKNLPNVIAVAGVGHGVGTSFVALNLAYILQAVLVEGGKTGTLAEWIGREGSVDREAYLHGESRNSSSFAVIASGELKSNDELNMLKMKATHQLYVVDCPLHSPVWRLAEHKIFVTSADPQYRHVAIPSDAKWVLNKMPQDFPVEPQKVFNRKPDLLVYENGREVMLSLWSKTPYLSKQGQGAKQDWMALISGGQSTSNSYGKGDDLEWNLGKTL